MRPWSVIPVVLLFSAGPIGCGDRTPDTADADTDSDADCGEPPAGFTAELEAAQITSTAYSNDSGIAAVIAALPGSGETAVVDLPIDHAVVSAVEYYPDGGDPSIWQIWIQDAGGAVHTFCPDTPIEEAIVPGMVVSFNVDEIENYFDVLEITKLSGFVVESGTEQVYVQDVMGPGVSYDDYAQQRVHVYGKIVSEPAACGTGKICADWDIGGGQTAQFRVKDVFDLAEGDCIEAIAPMGVFQDSPSFEMQNLDWAEYY